MSRRYYILALTILLAVAFRAWPSAIPQNTPPKIEVGSSYKVIRVIDGDTIKIEKDGHEETLRLLGIDTPETDPTHNPVECFGKEATTETKSQLLGKMITIEPDPKQDIYDKYHRLLVYVFKDGQNFNEHLVREGFAKEYTYAGAYKYQRIFRAAESEARNAHRGLWSEQTCPNGTTAAL
jgi:micrococcal nuclease